MSINNSQLYDECATTITQILILNLSYLTPKFRNSTYFHTFESNAYSFAASVCSELRSLQMNENFALIIFVFSVISLFTDICDSISYLVASLFRIQCPFLLCYLVSHPVILVVQSFIFHGFRPKLIFIQLKVKSFSFKFRRIQSASTTCGVLHISGPYSFLNKYNEQQLALLSMGFSDMIFSSDEPIIYTQ